VSYGGPLWSSTAARLLCFPNQIRPEPASPATALGWRAFSSTSAASRSGAVTAARLFALASSTPDLHARGGGQLSLSLSHVTRAACHLHNPVIGLGAAWRKSLNFRDGGGETILWGGPFPVNSHASLALALPIPFSTIHRIPKAKRSENSFTFQERETFQSFPLHLLREGIAAAAAAAAAVALRGRRSVVACTHERRKEGAFFSRPQHASRIPRYGEELPRGGEEEPAALFRNEIRRSRDGKGERRRRRRPRPRPRRARINFPG